MGVCSCFSRLAKQRITIEVPIETSNDIGAHSTTWEAESEAWAIITPKSGKETIRIGQLISEVSAEMIIRYQSVLASTVEAAKRRIKHGDRYYSIIAVNNLDKDLKREGRHYQRLYAKEGLA